MLVLDFSLGETKLADTLPILPHQQRVVDKLRASGGVLVAHGVGAGKTRTSIEAKNQLDVPAEVVVPAPLQENYKKELVKHTGGLPDDVRIRSYEKAHKDGDLNTSGLVVFDEAHKGRNAGTNAAELLREARSAPHRLLMTGTSVYNQPYDLANLLNAAAGGRVLPDDPTMFKKVFIGEKEVKPGLINRLRGMESVKVPVLRNKDRLVDAATGYVDVHKSGVGPDFPTRVDEEFDVPMSDQQLKMYRFHEGKMPWYLKAKIHAGLPMTKQESQELNAFQGALRQTANTPRPYVETMTDDEEEQHIPKIQKMLEELQKAKTDDPNFRAYVYSNYLGGGLHPYARLLDKAKVPYNLFTGETAPKDRARIVQEYNEGRVPIILASGAGSEGLDLQGTKLVQLMEPHWNQSRLDQATGRAIRFRSHAHLPENERKVRVQRFYSAFPKTITNRLGITKEDKTVERYMREMSDTKNQLAGEIMQALQEASDRGPLQPWQKTSEAEKVAAEDPAPFQEKVGFTLLDVLAGTAIGATTGALSDPEHRARNALLGGLGGATLGGVVGAELGAHHLPNHSNNTGNLLGSLVVPAALYADRKLRPEEPKVATDLDALRTLPRMDFHPSKKNTLLYTHPTGFKLEVPYDAEHLAGRETNPRDVYFDIQNGADAALGDIDKLDARKRSIRKIEYGFYGSLLGTAGGLAVGGILGHKIPYFNRLSPDARMSFGMYGGPIVGSALGSLYGGATYRNVRPDKASGTYKHPDLVAPKAVKPKARLNLKSL